MVATLEKLKDGIFTVSKSFKDGSVSWFRCTANQEVLRSMNLDDTSAYNIEARIRIPVEEIENEKLNIVEDNDIESYNNLDKYMNGGVNGEVFKLG